MAVAEFDAVVSGDIYVFVPKADRLLRELLPFICISERFFKFAVETSAGSLSPRTNWSQLANFEFDLPALDQQRCIAEMLWAMDEVMTKLSATANIAHAVVEAELDDFLYRRAKWPMAESRNLLAEGPRNGFSPPASESRGGVPTLSIGAIRRGEVVTEGSLKYAEVRPEDVAQFTLCRNDILVVRGNGNRLLCGRAGLVKDFPEGCFYPDLLIRLRFRLDALLPEFAVILWNESKTHQRLLKKAKSTNGIYKINGQDIQAHQLVVPPIAAQKRLLEELKAKANIAEAFVHSAAEAANVQCSLIQTLLE